MSNREAPCEVTGQPCAWRSDDEYDDAGEIIAWDLFCSNCYRPYDWTKDEAETTKPAPE